MICGSLKKCMEGQLKKVPLEKCDNSNRNICVEISDVRPAVKCEEHGKKYVYENRKRNHVISYKMDGGVIVEDKTVPPNTNKCDYLYVIDDAQLTAILIELKGDKVKKALEQLNGTIALYKNVFQNFDHVYARAIVTSSTPNLKATPSYVNLERMLRQTYHGNIKIVERQFVEKDEDLDKKGHIK